MKKSMTYFAHKNNLKNLSIFECSYNLESCIGKKKQKTHGFSQHTVLSKSLGTLFILACPEGKLDLFELASS